MCNQKKNPCSSGMKIECEGKLGTRVSGRVLIPVLME